MFTWPTIAIFLDSRKKFKFLSKKLIYYILVILFAAITFNYRVLYDKDKNKILS